MLSDVEAVQSAEEAGRMPEDAADVKCAVRLHCRCRAPAVGDGLYKTSVPVLPDISSIHFLQCPYWATSAAS